MKRHRCKVCSHTPRRVVSRTTKTAKGPEHGVGRIAEPREHKRPCNCPCHRIGDAGASDDTHAEVGQ